MQQAALLSCVLCLLCARVAVAQNGEDGPGVPPPASTDRPSRAAPELPDCGQDRVVEVAPRHWRYTGNVECELPQDVRVFADTIDLYGDDDTTRVEARGNVVFTGGEGHISSAALIYDTASGTGTFEEAHGFLWRDGLAPGDGLFGSSPDVYFTGERLEKLGPRRYRVTRGGWTTCEQPTPRWEFTSGVMVLNLDEYVVARNTVLRVKGVPLFYVPWIYYPLDSDDRSTGFLMPTYGTSTFRGQAVSNAFFWAIGRSHDATFFHDLFTRAGQGAGAEYRYVTGPQSSGTLRVYRFGRNRTESIDEGTTTVLPSSTGYEVSGTAVHALGRGFVARARVDYFSDVINQQVLHQDVFAATRRNRLVEGGLTGSFGPVSTTTVYERNEVINGVSDTLVYGGTPRVTATLAPRRLFGSPVYATVNAEYAYLPYRRLVEDVTVQDDSLGRLDIAPSVRVPLSRLPFLSINTSATYRGTHYTRQAGTQGQLTEDSAYLRQYATARTDVVGPVFNRIWDLADGRFADRLKHVIEPAISVDLTSPISGFRRTPLLSDPSDFVVGGSTRLTYGLTNRLFTRRTDALGRGITREILTLGLQQTYYSRPEASRFDSTYMSGIGAGADRRVSPAALTLRASPSGAIDGNARAEFDTTRGGLLSLTTGATLNVEQSGIDLSYSRQRLDRAQPASSFVSLSARTRLFQDSLSTSYALSWDLARSYVVSQSVVAAYMAQCCGFQAEYQQFNFPAIFGLPVSSDQRLNFSIVLAGLGTFSNFFGAFGGL
jgi:LPS-assembly protein